MNNFPTTLPTIRLDLWLIADKSLWNKIREKETGQKLEGGTKTQGPERETLGMLKTTDTLQRNTVWALAGLGDMDLYQVLQLVYA